MIRYFPVKIAHMSGPIKHWKHLEQLQYVFIQITKDNESINAHDWGTYQEFFDLCPNLKAVALGFYKNRQAYREKSKLLMN